MAREHDLDGGEAELGLTPADLPDLRRELFVDALVTARAAHEPSTEWEAFVEAGWQEVGLAFGLLEREPWPEGLERPRMTDED